MEHPVDNPRAAPSAIGAIALVLLIVGGINWALVGLLNVDLVAALFGPMSTPARVVYVIVGIAAVYALTLFPRIVRDGRGPAA